MSVHCIAYKTFKKTHVENISLRMLLVSINKESLLFSLYIYVYNALLHWM